MKTTLVQSELTLQIRAPKTK